MMTPIPGSIIIPMLGVPSTLASIDMHAVLAAASCVGVSLMLAWVVTLLQRHPQRTSGTRSWDAIAARLHLARHAA